MDRIDLHVEVPPVTAADLALPRPAEGTAEAAARVAAARALQEARGLELVATADRSGTASGSEAYGPGAALNARLEGRALEKFAAPDDKARALLTRAAESGGQSARGWTRTLRLARTIADLDGAETVGRLHVAEALIYRPATRPAEARPDADTRVLAGD
jgi:magnesium chelatase family protein